MTFNQLLGFPSTQQTEKINARAKQQKAVQEEYKKAEAECVLSLSYLL